jgi:hypothetical protein
MRTSLFFAFSVAALSVGCGGNNTMTGMDMGTTMSPAKPAMASTQLDRMGRPTINVAVTDPFNLPYTGTGMGGATRDATRLAYNSDSNQAMWQANWGPVLAKTLALYDGVDQKCGNQFGACANSMGCANGYTPTAYNAQAAPTSAGTYGMLADVLADDQLYINVGNTNCSFYLGVEANVLGVPGTNTLCGGRTPLVDVVDETYTAATVGFAGFPTPPATAFSITDGVNAKAGAMASLTTFPFLANPN